jgi:hypothetical protein
MISGKGENERKLFEPYFFTPRRVINEKVRVIIRNTKTAPNRKTKAIMISLDSGLIWSSNGERIYPAKKNRIRYREWFHFSPTSPPGMAFLNFKALYTLTAITAIARTLNT